MGMFDKLKFWKKDDDFDLDSLASKEMGLGKDPFAPTPDPLNQPTPGFQEKSPFDELDKRNQDMALPKPPAPASSAREMELISSKLDTIKAILESLDQRVARMEQKPVEKQQHKLW